MNCSDSNIIEANAFVADSLKPLLNGDGFGEVLMVNSAGIYLGVAEKVVLVCDSSWGYVPAGIALEDFHSLTESIPLKAGEAFSYCNGSFRFVAGTMQIVPRYSSRRDVSLLRAQPSLIARAASELASLNKTRGLSMLALPLILENLNADVFSINPFCERAYRGLVALINALKNENTEGIRAYVSGLLGLGVGLTPSADDVLMGMLYAFLGFYDRIGDTAKAFVDELPTLCENLTNSVSTSYIKAIRNGDVYERADRVLLGLCGELPLEIAQLTEVGGSSGGEMLLGMLCVLKVLR